MTKSPGSYAAAWTRNTAARVRRMILVFEAPLSGGAAPLRLGVERGMAAALTVVAVLLVLLSLPDFPAGHEPALSPLVVLSLCLAALLISAAPLALAPRALPARAGLWLSVAAYVGLLILEPFELRDPLPDGSTPWLLALSLIAFTSTAAAEASPVRAGLICAGLDAALACVYAGRIPPNHTLIDAVGLGLLAAGLIAGVRALRVRADQADAAEHQAESLFDEHQLQRAVEAERVNTDALLHDTVLATLLAAAGNEDPDRAASMAGSALDIVSDTGDRPTVQPRNVPFWQALASAETEFAPLRKFAEIDLTGAHSVEIPPDVAEALIMATLQALSNSIKHAGASAHRTAEATQLDGGGLYITISDDGAGFDVGEIAQERLGVRVSILERVRLVGGSADIRSSPGSGTTVRLEWRPTIDQQPQNPPTGETLMTLVPRRQLYRVLGALIVMAILTAISETVLFSHAIGPIIAAILGLTVLPALLRAAKTGTMRPRTAWSIGAVGLLLCCTATIGLDPTTVDCVSIYWYTCGILAGAVMVWMAGHKAPPIIAVTCLVAQITLWAGPTGAIRLGLAAEIVIVIACLMMHRAIRQVTAAADAAAGRHRELTTRQAELGAFHHERQQRLQRASTTAAPMLRQIITTHGQIDDASRHECRVLEQALRDEIRGRNLLNDAIRTTVSTHRRRGALVQILDDGGLESLPPCTLNALLDDAARHLEPVQSSRIVIRTGQPDSDTAITIVASTPDETASALGLDGDDEVDLWVTIPRPHFSGVPT